MLSAPGPQNPHDLEITYASLLVLPSSRLTGPMRKGPSQVVENACFCQPVYSRRELTDSPVGIPKARVAGDQAGVASVPTEQLIAFVTGDQGGNH